MSEDSRSVNWQARFKCGIKISLIFLLMFQKNMRHITMSRGNKILEVLVCFTWVGYGVELVGFF